MSVIVRLRRAARELLKPVPPPRHERDAVQDRKRTREEEKQRIRVERRERHETEKAALGTGGSDVKTVALDYPAHEIRLLVSSKMELEWRAHSCAKEPWTVDWLEASLRNGGVLYDIGANTGAFSLIAATLVRPHGGSVVAFEPGYASFAHLCDNIVLNRCQGVVIPVPLALGHSTGLATFTYKTLHPGQSRHSFSEKTWSAAKASSSSQYRQPMLSMSLDDLVGQFQLPAPTHIKLDVDGAELSVLRGASATLRSPGLQSLLVEVDDSMTDKVSQLLTESGFVLNARHKRIHTEKTQVWYGVFVRRP